MIGKLLNGVGYQLVWTASIVGAANGSCRPGLIATSAFAVAVLAFGGQRRSDLALLAPALLAGLLVESLWIALGWIRFESPWPSTHWTPAWMFGIWVAFALTFNHSLAFLKNRRILAAALGALGGPCAYWTAAKVFGALQFVASQTLSLIVIGIVWMGLLPLLIRIAERKGASARGERP